LEDKPANERVIRVTTSETDGIIKMSFADSGIGIEEGTTDREYSYRHFQLVEMIVERLMALEWV